MTNRIQSFRVGFIHTKWEPGDDAPGMTEKQKLAWASKHLGADYRNAVFINGWSIHSTGWRDGKFVDTYTMTKNESTIITKTRAAAFKKALTS